MSEIKPEFKKWLTEKVLGECCHEKKKGGRYYCSCNYGTNELQDLTRHIETCNRTFDNWKDYGDVVTAMKEKTHLPWETFFIWLLDNKNLVDTKLEAMNFITDKDLFFTTLQEWWEKEWK